MKYEKAYVTNVIKAFVIFSRKIIYIINVLAKKFEIQKEIV